jgi:lipoprotein NlpI
MEAAESQNEGLLSQAQAAFGRGETEKALAFAQKAVEADPKNPRGYLFRGRLHDALKQYEKAVADYSQVLQSDRNAKDIYQWRGVAQFKLGRAQESIADFDRYIQQNPSQAAHHWQRGISYYYAGRYEEGRKQFELHQTVNANDVENAVWHFLCVSRSADVKKARESLIKIEGDSRVPMMEVLALFAGKGTAERVLAAAQEGNPSAEELKQRLFYAHLYLGLFYEATGDDKLAKQHILKATDEYPADHYMGDVARVHAKLRWEAWMKN